MRQHIQHTVSLGIWKCLLPAQLQALLEKNPRLNKKWASLQKKEIKIGAREKAMREVRSLLFWSVICFAARYRNINLSFFYCVERSDLLTSQVDYNFLHKLIDKFFAVLDEVPAEGFITMEEVIYYVI